MRRRQDPSERRAGEVSFTDPQVFDPASSTGAPETDLGDIVVVLLASTLAGLRDRLAIDGFPLAAELVADLVEITEDFLIRVPPEGGPHRDPGVK